MQFDFFIIGAATITLASAPSTLSGEFCTGPAIFTCVGNEIKPNLFWEVNGIPIASYAFRISHMFPYPLRVNSPFGQNGVEAEIINAVAAPNVTSTYNIISELTVNNVSVLNSSSIGCAETDLRSDVIHVIVNTLSTYVSNFPLHCYSTALVVNKVFGCRF